MKVSSYLYTVTFQFPKFLLTTLVVVILDIRHRKEAGGSCKISRVLLFLHDNLWYVIHFKDDFTFIFNSNRKPFNSPSVIFVQNSKTVGVFYWGCHSGKSIKIMKNIFNRLIWYTYVYVCNHPCHIPSNQGCI